jgi:thiol-disulfide isomerase/thioredoxin
VLVGVVPDGIENGEVVYMTDYNDGIIVDSAVVSKGKFVFRGMADSAMARFLSIQDLQADVILDKGSMTVDMSDPYSSKGNPLTEKLNEFYEKCGEVIMQTRSKMAEIDETLDESERSALEDAIFKDFFVRLDEIPTSYLKDHPNDALGAMLFYIWMQNQFDLLSEQFTEASQLVGEYVLNFGPVKQMADYLDKTEKTAVGKPFLDFTVANGNRDGSTVAFSDYVGKGKYVLVDFWASWCMPCRKEAPVIAEVYKKYKGNRFEVLGVAVMDKRDDSLQAIDEDGYSWPQILDAQAVPLDLYGIQGIPHIILFGPDGTILARGLRGEELKQKVAEVMKL